MKISTGFLTLIFASFVSYSTSINAYAPVDPEKPSEPLKTWPKVGPSLPDQAAVEGGKFMLSSMVVSATGAFLANTALHYVVGMPFAPIAAPVTALTANFVFTSAFAKDWHTWDYQKISKVDPNGATAGAKVGVSSAIWGTFCHMSLSFLAKMVF